MTRTSHPPPHTSSVQVPAFMRAEAIRYSQDVLADMRVYGPRGRGTTHAAGGHCEAARGGSGEDEGVEKLCGLAFNSVLSVEL